MEQVLYRKYRPRSFGEIVGQEHVVQTLTNALAMGRVSHAYLFAGPRGSGKTTIARIFAKAVNCRDLKKGEPCNRCSSCLDINEGRSMDLVEIDAASHRGIDEIKDLRDGIKFAPTKSKYRVFILDEAHQLSRDAVNALLKTLEEPPSHAIFILATTEIHKMIATIISRCQRFDFRKLKFKEILGRLEDIVKKEKVKIEKQALELIALHSQGAARDAESLLGQVLTFTASLERDGMITLDEVRGILGISDIQAVAGLVDLLASKKTGEALAFLNSLLEKGHDLQEFIKSLISYFRHALVIKIDSGGLNEIQAGLTGEQIEKIKHQSDSFTKEDLSKILDLLVGVENRARYASIEQLPLELFIIEITGKKL